MTEVVIRWWRSNMPPKPNVEHACNVRSTLELISNKRPFLILTS